MKIVSQQSFDNLSKLLEERRKVQARFILHKKRQSRADLSLADKLAANKVYEDKIRNLQQQIEAIV